MYGSDRSCKKQPRLERYIPLFVVENSSGISSIIKRTMCEDAQPAEMK